jgi:hypothetical protein
MPSPTPPIRIVLTTVANPDEAARLGRTLVEERLAACATLIPGVAVHLPLAGRGRVRNGNAAAHQDRPRATGRPGSTIARVAQLPDPGVSGSQGGCSQPALPRLAAREPPPAVTPGFNARLVWYSDPGLFHALVTVGSSRLVRGDADCSRWGGASRPGPTRPWPLQDFAGRQACFRFGRGNRHRNRSLGSLAGHTIFLAVFR